VCTRADCTKPLSRDSPGWRAADSIEFRSEPSRPGPRRSCEAEYPRWPPTERHSPASSGRKFGRTAWASGRQIAGVIATVLAPAIRPPRGRSEVPAAAVSLDLLDRHRVPFVGRPRARRSAFKNPRARRYTEIQDGGRTGGSTGTGAAAGRSEYQQRSQERRASRQQGARSIACTRTPEEPCSTRQAAARFRQQAGPNTKAVATASGPGSTPANVRPTK